MEWSSPRGHLDDERQPQILVARSSADCNWFSMEKSVKVTFQDDPSPFSLGEFQSFKQELALIV